MEKKTWWQQVPPYWPILMTIVAIIGLGARADAQIKDHEVRLDEYDKLRIEREIQLTRIEESLKRIEKHMGTAP